jgi:hypothetical protein
MLALRAFEGLVNDDKTLINSYPEDFSLHYVGNLGDSDGRYYIDSSDESRVPLLVGRAVDYVRDLDEDPAK